MSKQILAEPEGVDTLAGPEELFFSEPVVEKPKPVDPQMDPGSRSWNPRKYFGAQPKVVVMIPKSDSDMLSNPNSNAPIVVPVSINGYRLDITKGVATRVPRDFALHIVDIGAGVIYSEIAEAREV